MLWFLRFFPLFRHLHDEVEILRSNNERLVQENLRLQDRLDAAQDDRKQLFDMVRQAIDNERVGYQTQINFHAQRHGDPPIYPAAQSLPETSLPTEESLRPIARRLLPSEMMANANKKFVNEFLAAHAPKA
ncbi:MAG: hypothetical protein ABFD89_28870 [Bryobacteraceae bacterium]